MTDDKLDMTLAFGEGWGNAYSSILRNDQIYADSFVLSLRQGFVFDITDTSGLQNNGWFNEDSVAKVIYGLYTRQNKDFRTHLERNQRPAQWRARFTCHNFQFCGCGTQRWRSSCQPVSQYPASVGTYIFWH